MDSQQLTMIEFEDEDFDKAEKIAEQLGYEQTAYTSTSALWGLFCIAENPDTPIGRAHPKHSGCIILTKELGFMFVQDGEDLHMGYMFGDIK